MMKLLKSMLENKGRKNRLQYDLRQIEKSLSKDQIQAREELAHTVEQLEKITSELFSTKDRLVEVLEQNSQMQDELHELRDLADKYELLSKKFVYDDGLAHTGRTPVENSHRRVKSNYGISSSADKFSIDKKDKIIKELREIIHNQKDMIEGLKLSANRD